MSEEEIRLECVLTGIGTGDLVRHRNDNRFGEVVSVFAKHIDEADLVPFERDYHTYIFEPSTILARVEFLVGWIWHNHPVIVRYYEDIPTFLLNKVECKICGKGICKCREKYD